MVEKSLNFYNPKVQTAKVNTADANDVTNDVARTLSYCSTREARALINFAQAEKLRVLPLGLIHFCDGQTLSVATANEHDIDLQNTLRLITGRNVRLIQVDEKQLVDAIFLAYKGDDVELEQSFLKADSEVGHSETTKVAQLDFRPPNGDSAIALASLFDYAVSKGASDIHLIPLLHGGCIKLRVRGELLSSNKNIYTRQLHRQMLSRLKILSSMDTTKRNTPQDGSFSFSAAGKDIFARVSIMPTVHGEKAAVRFMGTQGLRSVEELSFSPESLRILLKYLDKHSGLILFCGPTGSGKSTSMYAALEYLKKHSLQIVTIEDPVEIFLDGICQTNVHEELGLTFSTCLRSALRQDPDVLLVGEVRDNESAVVAVQAAMTGHLLLSTVHARTSLEVFMRFEQLGIDANTMAQALVAIVGQRLLPVLCDVCKVIDLAGTKRTGIEVYKEVGCAHCDYSGYSTRAPAIEILQMDAKIRNMLQNEKFTSSKLISALNPENYLPIKSSLDRMLKNGRISMRQYEEFLLEDSPILAVRA
ncbi:MAG: type II/IV secretion system protein [SAR324 cluster bacterium]|uniref:Type II/IV secretion system protein n=1 Tax=SAR324 cluster bacterium TaxID=2024889 RepID=A0A7X9IKV1_9DELT|nr:type II/IV secretion system protein [SAR324 cluster bacterium]